MTKGKFQAVVIIIVALLIIAVVCSWLINRDSNKPVVNNTAETGARVEINAADGSNYSSEPTAPTPESQGTTYTGTAPAGSTGNTGSSGNNGNGGNNGGNNNNNTAPTPDLGTVSTPAGTAPTAAPTVTPEATQTVENETVEIPEEPDPNPIIEGSVIIGDTETAPGYGQRLGSDTYYSNISELVALSANVSAETLNATQVKLTVTVSINSSAFNTIPGYVNMAVNGVFTTVPSAGVNYNDATYVAHELATQTFIIDIADGSSISVPIDISWAWGGNYAGQYIDTFECGGMFTIVRA